MLSAALLAASTLIATTGLASADDAKDCTDGVAMIKAEIAKAPPKSTLDKLNKALRGAQRELGEKEYDECLDFVRDAQKAVKK
ncbi:histidine kinase [Ancylobacter pratisalsi]|uniref:Histidine kinase n=2 Tax=Ancylobacter pratisalsi TaxID=1745854 RepID=A0A6P1YTH3_9HYPH|nr:histidine kinase [Ancylobacter pratisalsi]